MDARSRYTVYQKVGQAARAAGVPFSSYLSPDLERARYRLGSSSADRVLPYSLEPEVVECVRAALSELAVLYVGRNRRFVGEGAYDALLFNVEPTAAVLGPPAYRAPASVENPVVRRALERSAMILPGLDAGVLTAWWGSRGRALLRVLTDMHLQAVGEMEGSTGELTPVLLHWVLLSSHELAAKVLQPLDLAESVRHEVRAALLTGLHLVHHLVRSRVKQLRPQPDERLDLTWSAMLSPRVSFACDLPLLARCRFYPLRLDQLGDRAAGLVELFDSAGCDRAANDLLDWVQRDSDLGRQAREGLAVEWLSEQLVGLLAASPDEKGELFDFVQQTLRSPTAGASLLADKKRRKQTVRWLGSLADSTGNPEIARRLESLADRFRRYSGRNPARGLLDDDQVRERALQAWMAAAGDVLCTRAASRALTRLSLRTGSESDRTLDELYDSGRLYRFGPTFKPFLKVYKRAGRVGHYFIDVKDYTRQTVLLKEEIMAEFIRREFYEPILAIAREYYHGLPQLADRGGVHLNNLLGDAVSLSGDVVSLVRITVGIRQHLDRYARGLANKLERDGEKQELVAGSFISFGTEAVVLTFDDAIWGQVRVSIAEKINESARGTARAAQVLSSLRARLGHERQRTNNAALRPAFRVYVDQAALYNAGDALSGEALEAYCRAAAGEMCFVELSLPAERLEAGLRRQVVFFANELRLVAGVSPESGRLAELFRFAGTIVFKGFEKDHPVDVWEMVNPTDSAGRAFLNSPALAAAVASAMH